MNACVHASVSRWAACACIVGLHTGNQKQDASGGRIASRSAPVILCRVDHHHLHLIMPRYE